MTYTPHATWANGDVPVAADLNNWETGIQAAGLYYGFKAPFTPANPFVPFQVSCADGETIGSFTGDGRLHPPGEIWDATVQGTSSATLSSANGNSVSGTLLEADFTLPSHSACLIGAIAGRLSFGIYCASGTATITVTSIEVDLLEIASDGTVTVKDTLTLAVSGVTLSAQASTTHERKIYKSYGAGITIGSGNRAAARVRLIGSTGASGGGGTAYLNLDGTYYNGSYQAIDLSNARRLSIIAFRFD